MKSNTALASAAYQHCTGLLRAFWKASGRHEQHLDHDRLHTVSKDEETRVNRASKSETG